MSEFLVDDANFPWKFFFRDSFVRLFCIDNRFEMFSQLFKKMFSGYVAMQFFANLNLN